MADWGDGRVTFPSCKLDNYNRLFPQSLPKIVDGRLTINTGSGGQARSCAQVY
jgi:hypothetical protein